MNNKKDLTMKEIFDLAHKNHKNNNLQDAQIHYQKVLKIDPNHLGTHFNLGNIFGQLGEYQKAKDSYIKFITINPSYAAAHNNLGTIFDKLGDNQKSVECFKKAIDINPTYIKPYNNLGIVFYKLGELQKAISCYVKIIKIDPNHLQCINNLSTILKVSTFSNKSYLKELCLFLFKKNNINHNEISHNAISSLLNIKNNNQLKAAFDKNTSLLSNEIIQIFLNEELFHLILQKALIADTFLEKLLIRLRSEILFILESSNKDILKEHFNFIISLAEQCWLNEYVYINSEKENEAIDKLKNKLDKDKSVNEIEIAILACYMPLNKSKIISKKLLDYEATNILFNDLIIMQITEPLKEIELKKSIKSLGKIVDPVSKLVRDQYEENPYPRWRYTEHSVPKKISDLIGSKVITDIIKINNPNVLIAGCGTGNHTIQGTRYKNANILAIDLSFASLAYSKRKTEELGYKNIKYLNADILQLKKLGRKFDIIECVGTLHHMEDPIAGLKVLLNILEPHGYLKLGLYSEIARQDVVKVREFIKQQNFKNITKDIKKFRQDIIYRKVDPIIQKIVSTTNKDFYSISTLRDLLFHVQEHHFTIPQISTLLKDFNLEFLGFEIENQKSKIEFSKLFPNDKDNTSLDNWHQFELNNPNTFIGMYQFYIKKNNDK